MWVLRRAFRLLTADEGPALRDRFTREARRILVGAAITLALLVLGAVMLLALLISLVT